MTIWCSPSLVSLSSSGIPKNCPTSAETWTWCLRVSSVAYSRRERANWLSLLATICSGVNSADTARRLKRNPTRPAAFVVGWRLGLRLVLEFSKRADWSTFRGQRINRTANPQPAANSRSPARAGDDFGGRFYHDDVLLSHLRVRHRNLSHLAGQKSEEAPTQRKSAANVRAGKCLEIQSISRICKIGASGCSEAAAPRRTPGLPWPTELEQHI